MELLKIVGFGMTAAALSLLIKQSRPEYSMAIPVIVAAAVFGAAAPYIKSVISLFEEIAGRAGMEEMYFRIVIKMIGAAYVTCFASEICRDAGENAVAGKIEFGGKILIISMSMPILESLLSLVSDLINFS